MVEEIGGLEHRDDFVRRAKERIALIDGARPKIRLVVDGKVTSEDVRGDAAKIYKERAREFGRMLREGTLGKWMEKRREMILRMAEESRARRAKQEEEPASPDPAEDGVARGLPSRAKLRYGPKA